MPAKRLGKLIAVSGCFATAVMEPNAGEVPRAEIGSLIKIVTPKLEVIGVIRALSSRADHAVLIELTLVGELSPEAGMRKSAFRRGVAHFPSIGDEVLLAGSDDLTAVYIQRADNSIDIGTQYLDPTVPAHLLANDLLSKHFLIVGTTGSGKSSALTGILRKSLADRAYAHVLVLDIHGEYHRAFGPQAELISNDTLYLPYWLLNFQELRYILVSKEELYEAQTEILTEAVIFAKKRYSEAQAGRLRTRVVVETAGVMVDTPTPFRLSDLVAYIDEQLGKLERTYPTLAYRRLKARIETLSTDVRYGFMFGNPNMEDNMVDILGKLFRVPNDGKPITVIDLSMVPGEILDVVILLIGRLLFDLAVWSDGALPLLLVCEEAHRYIPSDDRKGFLPTRQALARIAKEGRKYGLSLALLTQRPSELDTTIISQCSTVIAMRLSTEDDQRVMRANAHDSSFGLLEYLPLLADREAIVVGQGAPMPMRIKFHEIPSTGLPGKQQHEFMMRWAAPNMDRRQLEDTVARWRGQGRTR